MKKIALLLAFFAIGLQVLLAQTKEITGKVTSADDGGPLPGATVSVKGTTLGTITDMDGAFRMKIPQEAKTLVISYIGMKTIELAPGTNLSIKMEKDDKEIDEIMVVAYGTTKKSSFTGSASSVGKKDLEIRPIANASQALSGIAPGIQVTSGMGQPGEGIDVRIRGFGSVNASSAPIYVVDGAIFNGNISEINPSDIESMTVLKDAASTSLYGSSAGNGVILITTKRGKSPKPSITFSISQGTSERAIPEYDRVDVWNYMPAIWAQIRNDQFYNKKKSEADAATFASANLISNYLRYNPFKGIDNKEIVGADGKLNPAASTLLYGDDLDWLKAITRQGYRGEYNVNYSSQTQNSDSYVSLGYLKENGYSIKSDYERYSGRAQLNYQLTKWLKTGINLSAFRTQSTILPASTSSSSSLVNPFYFSRFIGPIYPIHVHDDITGEYVLGPDGQKIYDFDKQRGSNALPGRHVIAETLYNDTKDNRDGINTRTYMDINLYKGLKFTTNVAYDNSDRNYTQYQNRIVGDSRGAGLLTKVSSRSTTVTFNQLLNYTKKFGEHNIEAMMGHENYYYRYAYSLATKKQQVLDGVLEFANFVTPTDMNSYTNSYNKEGYFGRVNYDYQGKYYASFSYRHDGSSRFSRDARWGNFWSTGLSWRMSEEQFVKQLGWVNDMKLRASYGETGNDQVLDASGYDAYYPYQSVYSLGYNNFETAGIAFSAFGNDKLKWETQVSYDLALEFALFKKLVGTIEYFNKESKDLLFSVPLPLSSGVTSIWQNIGKIKNKGVEIDLKYDIIAKKDFGVTLGTNATMLKNEIKELPKGQKEIIVGTKKYMVGKSIYDFWLREYRGVDANDGMPLYKYDYTKAFAETDCRIVGTDTLTTNVSKAKYHYSGSSIPKIYGGFNTTVRYKSFSANAVFSYQLGGKAYDNSYASLMAMNSMGGALHVDAYEKSWKKPGDITNVPRLDLGQSSNFNGALSDRWLISSNTLVFKTLSFGYTFPKSLISKIDIANARLTLNGENLYFWTKRKGLNSMQNYAGTNSNIYSAARTYTIGLQVTF